MNMTIKKRILSALLVFCMIFGMLPLTSIGALIGIVNVASAAPPPAASSTVKNYITRVGGIATELRVDFADLSMYGVRSAKAFWIDKGAVSGGAGGAGGTPVKKESAVYNEPLDGDEVTPPTLYNTNITQIKIPIVENGFQNDTLYQIKIEFYSDTAATTDNKIGFAETVFMRGTTINARDIESRELRSVKPGEREVGFKPAIEYAFVSPRVYIPKAAPSGATPEELANLRSRDQGGAFTRIFQSDDSGNPTANRAGYKTALAAIQRLKSGITEFKMVLALENYIFQTNTYVPLQEIWLGWDDITADGTPADGRLIAEVDFRGGETYTADVAKVNASAGDDDWHRVYLSGRLDGDTQMPQGTSWNSDAIPSEIRTSLSSALRHKDIYPGASYRFHTELHHFAGTQDERESSGTGFEVVGERMTRDVDTALRTIVSKISEEYVKIEVFRINRGQDYFAGNGYRVTVSPETSSSFEPEMEVTINDFADAPASVEAYVRVSKPTVTYYYRAYYTRAGGVSSPSSVQIPYVLQDAGDSAPIQPKGVTVEKIEYNPVTKTTDVTVSWDRPDNWNITETNDLYIEFDLNTSNTESDTPYELSDGEGGKHGSFALAFRTVLAVRRELIETPTADRLRCTIPGDKLFTVAPPDIAVPPADAAKPHLDPSALYNAGFWTDMRNRGQAPGQTTHYPANLLPNTRYFLTLRTAMWSDANNKASSATSSVVAFTTYPTKYTVPLPFEFTVTANPVPVPPAYENSVSLQNSAVDWRYASTTYKPPAGPLPVYYELYISDTPTDIKPELAGVTNRGADGAAFASWNDPAWAAGMSLPPPGASNPGASDTVGLSSALITGVPSTQNAAQGAAGQYINWDSVKKYKGAPLEPNRIYYFWIRTYILEDGKINGDKTLSVMISATTPPWRQGHDDVFKRLIAPTDFAIAKDAAGNLLVTGESATFEWTQTRADVLYELTITSVRDVNGFFMPDGSGLLFGDPALSPALDSVYESYIKEFTGDDGNTRDRRLLLDPDKAGRDAAAGGIPGFVRNNDTGKFNFTVRRWLFPNSLYYVSLRAVARDPSPDASPEQDPSRAEFYSVRNNTSPFVTVPLTTLLLDAPYELRTIDGAELSFSFADTSIFPAADFKLYLRGPGQSAYQLIGGSQGQIVKTDGFVYVKVTNLDFGEEYDTRVTRGNQNPENVYSKTGVLTRDAHHSVEVEWKGEATEPNDAFLRYQVAVISQREMSELPSEEVEYYELSDLNLKPFTHIKDGKEYPYAILEDSATVSLPGNMLYRAVILSKPTKLADGTVAQRPLEANMRYYIKVRTRKISRDDSTVSAYSKFVGPTEARTDFSQLSQDEVEEQNRLEDNMRGLVAEYERETYYVADSGDRTQGKFLLKEDKVVGMIGSSPSSGYVIDVSENLKQANADTLYIPGGVLLALTDFDKSLTIRVDGAEYTLSRNTIDLRNDGTYQALAKRSGTAEFLIRLKDSRSGFAGHSAPNGASGITDIHRLEAAVIASARSYQNISGIIKDYIYNERSGLLNSKLAALETNTERIPGDDADAAAAAAITAAANANAQYDTEEETNRAAAAEEQRLRDSDAYMAELVNDMRNQVSNKIGDIIEGRNGYRNMFSDIANVTEFAEPINVTLTHQQKRDGRVSPYISYDGKEWFTLSRDIARRPNSVTFGAVSPGYYSALFTGVTATDVVKGTDDSLALSKVVSRFELGDIFPGIYNELRGDLPVKNSEAVQLYERVLGLEGETFGMNMAQKIAALGLSDIVRTGTQNAQMERQRAAALLARLYAGLSGVGGGKVAAGAGSLSSTDASSVDAAFRADAGLCVEKGLLALTGGKFEPARGITRSELLRAVAGMI